MFMFSKKAVPSISTIFVVLLIVQGTVQISECSWAIRAFVGLLRLAVPRGIPVLVMAVTLLNNAKKASFMVLTDPELKGRWAEPPAATRRFLACWNEREMAIGGVWRWLLVVFGSTRPEKHVFLVCLFFFPVADR